MGMKGGQRPQTWAPEKRVVNQILKPDGVFLYFGWNTVGMGKKYDFRIVEIMLVCHGAGHNDTICLAEKRWYPQNLLRRGHD
jgi:hypothetical protein